MTDPHRETGKGGPDARPWVSDGESRATSPYVALGALLAVYVLSSMDRQLVAILAESIKHDLDLSDGELGLLSGTAFAFFYVVAGIPLSWLADRVNRVRVVALSCLAWSAMTAATGLAGTFAHLALLRMGVGIGEAGGTAPSFSLLSDFFPPARRARANAVFSFGTPLGVMLGTTLAGVIAAEHGWRAAFVVAGALGLIVAPLLLFIREPVRGRFAKGPAGPAMPAKEVLALFRRPVIFLLTLNTGISAFAGWVLLAWTPAFLMRLRDMSLGEIGLWYSPVIGIALALGGFAGGMIADRYATRDRRIYAVLPAVANLVSIPLVIIALQSDSWQVALPFLALPSLLTILYLAPSLALLHELVPPSGRTLATAILILVLNVFGIGCGPLVIGALSDAFTPAYGERGLEMALYVLVPVMLVAVLAYGALAVAIGREDRRNLTLQDIGRDPDAR